MGCEGNVGIGNKVDKEIGEMWDEARHSDAVGVVCSIFSCCVHLL